MSDGWDISQILNGKSKISYDELKRELVRRYRADGLPDRLVSEGELSALAFNLLLLREGGVSFLLDNAHWDLQRSIVVPGDSAVFGDQGSPAICHKFLNGEESKILICVGLHSIPVAIYTPGVNEITKSSHFSRYGNDVIIQKLAAYFGKITTWTDIAPEAPPKRVVFYTGPLNYIHDLTNTLSGFVTATQFYRSIEVVRGMGSYFGSPGDFSDPLCALSVGGFPHYHAEPRTLQERFIVSRPVAFYVSPLLLAKLREMGTYDHSSPPTIAVAVRGQNRICTNETEFLTEVVRRLAARDIGYSFGVRKRQFRVLVLGWLWPTGASADYKKSLKSGADEAAERVNSIVRSTSKYAPAEGVTGVEMRNAIPLLRSCRSYVSPCGTLNHLLSGISGSPGMIFGPITAITQARDWNERCTGAGNVAELPDQFIRNQSVRDPRASFSVDLDAAAVATRYVLQAIS